MVMEWPCNDRVACRRHSAGRALIWQLDPNLAACRRHSAGRAVPARRARVTNPQVPVLLVSFYVLELCVVAVFKIGTHIGHVTVM